MTHHKPVREVAPLIGLMCLMAGAALCVAYCQGCSRPAEYPAYCTDEHAFTARLLACVDEAARETRGEDEFRARSRMCRAAVHERCGISTVGAKDGGAP